VNPSTITRWCNGEVIVSDRDRERLALLLRREKAQIAFHERPVAAA